MDMQAVKEEYIYLITKFYQDTPEALKNIEKVKECEFVLDESLEDSANTDNKRNIITFGPDVNECTIFHELDHIRKGMLAKGGALEAVGDKVEIIENKHGIFFDEAITEYIAQELYKNSKYYFKIIGKLILGNRNFYATQIDVIIRIAQIVNIEPKNLCLLIENRYTNDDKTIDEIFKQKTGLDFEKILDDLDTYGTSQYISLLCDLGEISSDNTVLTDLTEYSKEKAIIAIDSVNDKLYKFIYDINNGDKTSQDYKFEGYELRGREKNEIYRDENGNTGTIEELENIKNS